MAKEPARELDHAQLAEAQVELWLASPVTKMLLQCFEWKRLDSVDAAGSGRLVDSGSADLTHGLLHRQLGLQDAFAEAQKPEALLDFYEMIFHPPPEEDDE